VQMRAEILKVHRAVTATAVYVTHDQVEALTMGDRIVVMNHGRIHQVGTPCELYDAPVDRLMSVMKVVEVDEFSRLFPSERWARVRIALRDGRTIVSSPTQARGGAENPLTHGEIADKFHTLAHPVLGPARAGRIEALVCALADDERACDVLRDELLQPIH